MSKQWLTIEFDDLNGSAFEGEDLGPEIGRILRKLAARLETMSREQFVDDDADCKLLDINGNKVGSVSGNFEADDEQEKFDAVREYTKWMERSDIAVFLYDYCGIQVNTNDSDHELVEAIVQAIDDGTTTLSDLEEFAGKS